MRQESDPGFDGGIATWRERGRELRTLWGEPGSDATLDERRAFARRLGDALADRTALPPDPSVEIREIPLPGAGGQSYGRVYEPPHADGATQLFLHGGGFAFGGPREQINDSLLSARAAATGIRFVSYAYSLAPEAKYPVQRDEVVAALNHLRAHADELGIDVRRLGIGGASAGGSIAASAALLLAREGAEPPFHVCLEVPSLSASQVHVPGPDVHPDVAAQLAEYPALLPLYAPERDELAFIGDAASLEGFPPALFALAEFDALTPGAQRVAQRLRAQGTPVVLRVLSGHVHGSPGATAVSSAAREWQDFVARELRAAYGTRGAAARSDSDARGDAYAS